MNKVKWDAVMKTLNMIVKDMGEDATYYDGKEFNGRNVAEYMGVHGAAIQALANIVKLIIEEDMNHESIRVSRKLGDSF